jgi:hypothetical protein
MLLKALEDELSLYEKLRDLVRRECESLGSEGRGTLMDILREKMDVMARIDSEGAGTQVLKDEWKKIPDRGAPEHGPIRDVLRAMERTLKEVLEYEEKSRQLFEAFKSDLQSVTEKTKALRASQAYKEQSAGNRDRSA